MWTRTLEVPSPSGFTLYGDVTVRTRSRTALLYIHGLGSHRKGDKSKALAAAAFDAGWAFAAFDFHGHGQSGGTLRDLRCSRLQQDLDAILDALRAENLDRFYLVGSSMGGWAACWLAKRQGPSVIPAVVVLAPAFRFPQTRLTTLTPAEIASWRTRGFHTWTTPWMTMELDWNLMVDAEKFPLSQLGQGWRTPLRIYHGGLDDIVPWKDSLEFFEGLGPGPWSLTVLAEGDHRLTAQKTQIMKETIAWFGEMAVK